jgi:hypothetical protein
MGGTAAEEEVAAKSAKKSRSLRRCERYKSVGHEQSRGGGHYDQEKEKNYL